MNEKEKYSLEFEIQDLPKTYNQIGRSHWSVKAKEAQKWKKYVYLHTIGKRPSKPLTKAKLILIRCSSQCPDPDGLVSSFKHTIDGLTEAEIIAGDTFNIIGMPEYRWEKAPREYGRIKVKVIEE